MIVAANHKLSTKKNINCAIHGHLSVDNIIIVGHYNLSLEQGVNSLKLIEHCAMFSLLLNLGQSIISNGKSKHHTIYIFHKRM